MMPAATFLRLCLAAARLGPAIRLRSLRPQVVGTALTLLAAGQGASAKDLFTPGTLRTLHAAGSLEPIAAAGFSDDCLFVLDARMVCQLCVPGLDTCEHEPFARLLHLQRLPGSDDWRAEEICGFLPAASAGLMVGPDSTLVLSFTDGSLRRLKLFRQGDGWRVSLDEQLLSADRFAEWGFPGRWQTFAIAPDGGIILGFDRSIARLPAGGAKRKEDVRWLYRPVFGPLEGSQATLGAALLVAVDGHGRVWVADAAARTLFRIVPGSTKVKTLVKPETWPADFTPYDIGLFGRHLFISGMAAGIGDSPNRLLVLTPEGQVQSAARQTITHQFNFAVTPGGHVVLCDWENGRVRLLPNLEAEEPIKGEAKAEAAAQGPGGPAVALGPGAAVESKKTFTLNPKAAEFHMPDG